MPAWMYLNTDASKPSRNNPSGVAAIGAVLRQHVRGSLVVVDYISRTIEEEDIHRAEYRALIAGLKMARFHDPATLHVYSDRATLVTEITKEKPKRKKYEQLHRDAGRLIQEFGDRIRISYVPREMNIEADQRAADAYLKARGRTSQPPSSSPT